MSVLNPKKSEKFEKNSFACNGLGKQAAKLTPYKTLQRLVLNLMLFNNLAYKTDNEVIKEILEVSKKVTPQEIYSVAVMSRDNGIRNASLLMIVIMTNMGGDYKKLVPLLIEDVCTRIDMLLDLVKLYRLYNRKSLPRVIKKGINIVLNKANEYTLAKYYRSNSELTLRDLLRTTHPIPKDENTSLLFKSVVDGSIKPPITWEVVISDSNDKRSKEEKWNYLLENNFLNNLSLTRNIRNLLEHKVPEDLIIEKIMEGNFKGVTPLNFYASYVNSVSKKVRNSLELKMIEDHSVNISNKRTCIVLDVSGSMSNKISNNSDYNRIDIALSFAIICKAKYSDCEIVFTAEKDKIADKNIKTLSEIIDYYKKIKSHIGYDGIYTRRVCDFVREKLGTFDNFIVISDSQDCDRTKKLPNPPVNENGVGAIIDVSGHKESGIDYNGVWEISVSTFSDNFLKIIDLYRELYN